MAGIPEEVIDAVRARVDIVDLIQSYIPLKKQGRDFKACCPFHSEKTPSFTVRPDRQYYHCFGCGKHGNAISFVMERENVDFPTAIRLLAQKYNIYIPEEEERRSRPGARQYPGAANQSYSEKKDRLFLLHEKLREWYVMNLRNNPEAPVAQYLATRNLSPESIQRFSLGMSLDSWDSAMVFAKNLGFTEAELAEGGIIKTFDDNPSKRYDLFRNRLMFPIWDELGRVVGFSARTIESDPKAMKYVNTPETPIFKKGRILYGMHLARSEMSDNKLGCAILCEGQLDVIAMHAAGFPNSVAAEGTAFTPEQARMLRRYTGKIKLALDSDNAGTKAVFKDAEILLPLGFDVKVVRFPGGKDPDELLKQQGREAIAEAIAQAVDFFDFAVREFSAKHGASPAGKAQTATAVLQLISLLESEASKTAYTSWLAEKLGLSADGLYAELVRTARKEAERRERYARYEQGQNPIPESEPVIQKPESQAQKRYKKALMEVLEVLLKFEEAAAIAAEQIPPEFLDQSPFAVAINEVIQAKMLEEWSEAPQRIIEKLEPQGLISQELSLLLMGENDSDEDSETPAEGLPPEQIAAAAKEKKRKFEREKKVALKVLAQDVNLLKEFHLNIRMESLMERFARLAPDDPEKLKLMEELGNLSRERMSLRK